MKLCIIILLLDTFSLSVLAQNAGSNGNVYNVIPGDSIIQKQSIKLDSIESEFYQNSDNLRRFYQIRLSKLESVHPSLQHELDSLTSLQLPTAKTEHIIDSVNQLREKAVATLNAELQTLKDKTSKRLKEMNLPPELGPKVSSITRNVENFKLPSAGRDITSFNLPDSPLGNGILKSSLPNAGKTEGLKDIMGGASEVSGITGSLSDYSEDLKQVAKGDLTSLDAISKMAEDKAAQMSGLSAMQQQTQGLEEYSALVGQARDPNAMQEQAVQQLQQSALNHFAGKEQQIQKAMETISKYKKKYANAPSIGELPKRPPNEMQGKPLAERLIPGIAIQIQKKGIDLLVDFNPYVGYRFTGNFTAGLGWNQRVAYNTHGNSFNSEARVYGPRSYAEYKAWKGFSPRVEIEVVNAYVKPFTSTSKIDQDSRQWIWGAFVGIKKEYRFIKRVNGTALIMTRLFDPHHKSPYADVINARFGFEFPMKKKIS